MENAKKYFDKYGKLKRTYEALNVLTKETEEELHYLESVAVALDMAKSEDDLLQIREELVGRKKSKNREQTSAFYQQ